ncbi:MAG: hypothetical protein L3J82_00225 [Planctomycetes bacterium]|nr:hypothetical protein [Planctomycetota bacterium]
MADHTDRLKILMDDDIDKSARDDIEMYIEGHVGLKVELDKEQADMPNMHYNILKMEHGLAGMNESLRTDNYELKQILPLLENGVEELNRAMTKIHQDG